MKKIKRTKFHEFLTIKLGKRINNEPLINILEETWDTSEEEIIGKVIVILKGKIKTKEEVQGFFKTLGWQFIEEQNKIYNNLIEELGVKYGKNKTNKI